MSLECILEQPPQYGANERAVEMVNEGDVRYIRITDVDEYGNLRENSKMTAESIDERYLLTDGDILFARSGATAGKTFLYRPTHGKGIFAGYMIKFKIDTKKANPEYIFDFTQTKMYDLWVKTIQRPSGQPNINSEEFKSLQIPLPPRKVQDSIVAEVKTRRVQVDRLKREASRVVLDAQEQVSKMILA